MFNSFFEFYMSTSWTWFQHIFVNVNNFLGWAIVTQQIIRDARELNSELFVAVKIFIFAFSLVKCRHEVVYPSKYSNKGQLPWIEHCIPHSIRLSTEWYEFQVKFDHSQKSNLTSYFLYPLLWNSWESTKHCFSSYKIVKV